jgi:Sulfotransferase family
MITQNDNESTCKYVFVCGLPRSGTSVLGRNIARLENCAGLKNTGALEDEGQYLQDVYPLARDCGGDGKFGFDPRMHLTEKSDLLTPENVARLTKSWSPYWDQSKTVFVEKTPANLLMTRFLQAAFPNVYFVVIWRHPVPVSIAIQKWKVNLTSLYNLFEHWLQCRRLFDQDRSRLNHLYELKYEDYVNDPDKYHREIANFIGVRIPESPKEDKYRVVAEWRNPGGRRVPEDAMEEVSGAHNQKYFKRWSSLLNNSRFRRYYQYIALKYEPRFADYGYSLTTGFGINQEQLREAEKISAAAGALYCLLADSGALAVRATIQSKGRIKRQIRARLPETLQIRIKHLLQQCLSKEGG